METGQQSSWTAAMSKSKRKKLKQKARKGTSTTISTPQVHEQSLLASAAHIEVRRTSSFARHMRRACRPSVCSILMRGRSRTPLHVTHTRGSGLGEGVTLAVWSGRMWSKCMRTHMRVRTCTHGQFFLRQVFSQRAVLQWVVGWGARTAWWGAPRMCDQREHCPRAEHLASTGPPKPPWQGQPQGPPLGQG